MCAILAEYIAIGLHTGNALPSGVPGGCDVNLPARITVNPGHPAPLAGVFLIGGDEMEVLRIGSIRMAEGCDESCEEEVEGLYLVGVTAGPVEDCLHRPPRYDALDGPVTRLSSLSSRPRRTGCGRPRARLPCT